MVFANRGLEIKTARRSTRCGSPGSWWAETLEMLRAAGPPGRHDRRARRHRGGQHPRPRRHPVVPGLRHRPSRRRSARRSTTRWCTASPARRARGRRHHLDRLRRDRRRLARRRRDHRPDRRGRSRGHRADAGHRGVPVARHRGGPARRPGHRHLARGRDHVRSRGATASSRTTSATASAPRCTWRPTSPTTAAAAADPTLVEGLALAVEPMVTLGHQGDGPPRRRLDRGHDRRLQGRPLRAHLHPHAGRRLGAHRPRRRRGAPCRARRPVRGALSRVDELGRAPGRSCQD